MSTHHAIGCFLALVWAGPCRAVQEPTHPVSKTTESAKSVLLRITALRQEHEGRTKNFYEDLRLAKRDVDKVSQLNNDFNKATRKLAEMLIRLIKEHEKDPDIFEGILLLVGPVGYPLDDELVRIVRQRHLANPKMGRLAAELRNRSSDEWAEQLLQDTASGHPDRNVRGQAEYALGDYYRYRVRFSPREMSDADRNKWHAEAACRYAAVLKSYSSVPMFDGGTTLGEKATHELARLKNIPELRVGNPAPEIEGIDVDGVNFKLSEYRGKVVVLDFWGHW